MSSKLFKQLMEIQNIYIAGARQHKEREEHIVDLAFQRGEELGRAWERERIKKYLIPKPKK